MENTSGMKFVYFIVLLSVGLGLVFVGGIQYPNKKLERSKKAGVVQLSQLTTVPGKSTLQIGAVGVETTTGTSPTPVTSCTLRSFAINMLLDTSNSIEAELPEVKKAVINFAKKLNNDTIIGVEDFSGGSSRGRGRVIVPIGNYDATVFESAINRLTEDEGNSFSQMKDGFTFAKETIDAYTIIPNYRDWVFIFFSDGKPTSAGKEPDPNQDPSPVAGDMRNRGMRIITIALGANADKGLMRRIATAPEDFHDASTVDQLQAVYDLILQTVLCE